MMLTANTISEYILSKNNSNEGELTSHLQLQKLLYYCQGFHLAILNKALFNEKIEHWDHGPVVPVVYQTYKKHGNNSLPSPQNFDDSVIPKDSKNVIDEVLDVYGQFAAWKLRKMTHNEPPWANTNDCEIISHHLLKRYFKTQIN